MVLASLQKYGRGRNTAMVTVAENITKLVGFATSVDRNTAGWKSAKEDFKQLNG